MQCHCVEAEHEVLGMCKYSSIRAVFSCLTMSLLDKYLISNSEIETDITILLYSL